MDLAALFLLGFAIASVWLRPMRTAKWPSIPPWVFLFAAAIVSGLISDVLRGPAIAGLSVLWLSASVWRSAQPGTGLRIVSGTATAFMALALALHQVPGFANPVIFGPAALSDRSAAFTQHANFDKGAVGLALLIFMCRLSSSLPEILRVLRKASYPAVVTVAVVLTAAISIGYVAPDPKFGANALTFLMANLFLTVIPEEAFFRGFLQDRLASVLQDLRYGGAIAVIISALLFGLAHAAGGLVYVVLSGLTGLGCAYAYFLTQRIEAPIAVHFTLNTAHYILFTYPFRS